VGLELEVKKLTEASAGQTEASQALAQEVSGKMAAIDLKVNSKIVEMDSKITQATSDIIAAIDDRIDMVIYVDTENGNADNDGLSAATPINSVVAALKKTLSGTYTQIYLKGGGQTHVIDEDYTLINQVILFASWNGNDVKAKLTHAARKVGDKIVAYGLSLSRDSMFISNSVDIITCRWQEWVSSGSFVSYELPLFKTYSTYPSGGKVVIYKGAVEINNSPLINQHTAGGVGWLDSVCISYSTVSKRDLSSDLITTGLQYLLEQYGNSNIIWDFTFHQSSIDTGETLPDLISPNIIKDCLTSTVPLTA